MRNQRYGVLVFLILSFVSSGCAKEASGEKEDIVVAAVETVESTEETTEETNEEINEEIIEESTEGTTTEFVSEIAESDSCVSFLFAGDICLEEDGFVLDYYDLVGGDLQRCISPSLLERMASADLFMLNHEYCISARGSRLNKYYTFRAKPERMELLKEMSVDIVSLANNHVYDYGYDAFSDTIDLLDQAGICHVGAGRNSDEAEQVVYFDVKGIRIGVVAASRAEKNVITPQATKDRAGVFWMYDDTRLKEVVKDANEQCDFLIAYLHWGTEDSNYFEAYQHEIAEELVALGVDAIIGGHSHRVQGMEFIGEVPVLYSLGDFWFNGEDKYSILVQLNIYKDGSCETEITACRQKDYKVIKITEEQEKEDYFSYLSRLSPNVSFH